MPVFETSTRKLLERLRAGGWVVEGGTKHTKFAHPANQGSKLFCRGIANKAQALPARWPETRVGSEEAT